MIERIEEEKFGTFVTRKTPGKCALVAGGGIASEACHVLLRKFGWSTASDVSKGPATAARIAPFIAINEATWRVIADVFGQVPKNGFATRRRLVAHHGFGEISSAEENHWVLAAGALRGLGRGYQEQYFGAADVIQTSVGADDQRNWILSGRREAWICGARASVAATEARRSLIFEFVPMGWVFWAPTQDDGRGFLQFVLADGEGGEERCSEILRSTRLIRQWITVEDEWLGRRIPCAAEARQRLVEARTTFCGAGAMRFDPIAGDGTGASLRSAILASAALRYSWNHPGTRDSVWRHYEMRMKRAFRDHVKACLGYYAGAGFDREWDGEVAAVRDAWLKAEVECTRQEEPLQYKLENLSLAGVLTRRDLG